MYLKMEGREQHSSLERLRSVWREFLLFHFFFFSLSPHNDVLNGKANERPSHFSLISLSTRPRGLRLARSGQKIVLLLLLLADKLAYGRLLLLLLLLVFFSISSSSSDKPRSVNPKSFVLDGPGGLEAVERVRPPPTFIKLRLIWLARAKRRGF